MKKFLNLNLLSLEVFPATLIILSILVDVKERDKYLLYSLVELLESLIFVLDISQPDPYTYLLTLICLVFTLIFQNSEISHNTNLYVNT